MAYKLLLADDSVTIQRVIELTFADEDVTVTAVGDGQAAIDRIQADPPDIVLADVGMPGRDGYEVAAFVKDSAELAHIPVLLLTGAFEPVDEGRAAAVRCNGVLAKPFEPQLLIGRVKELLAATPRGTGAVPEPPQAGAEEPADFTETDRDDTGPVPIAQVATAQTFTADDFSLDTRALVTDEMPATPAGDISLDDYFDRLDAAFANLSGAPAGQLKSSISEEGDTSWAPPSAGAWTAADPTSLMSPVARVPEPALPSGEAAAPAPPAAAVTVADAFAALLEAEQQGSAGGGSADRTVRQHEGILLHAPAAPIVTEALLDEIVHRIAERLGAQGLQEMVERVVLETAERLVREEIARLKASAQG